MSLVQLRLSSRFPTGFLPPRHHPITLWGIQDATKS